ncbi:MAG: hypothetical protein IPM96_07865 [Ignavibacteria bacterium]|nr:hypothetical protein [Ignavibacteria bacterium]
MNLGEIENVISEFGGIKNTAVTAKEFIGGDKRLFAYIVTNDGNEIEKDNLVKFLKIQDP